MRFFLAALVGCLSLASLVSADDYGVESHYNVLRPRLGHFKEHPFIDLYKSYAAAFVLPNFPDRSNDDFRNYLPSADDCVVYLDSFRNNEYQPRDVDELILLDACLGYLYESKFHELDSELSSNVRDNLQDLINLPQLRDLYEKTSLGSLSHDGQECIGDLLLSAVRAKKQFSDVVCNNHWLHVFNTFAECQKEIPVEFRHQDSYGKLLYDLVKIRGNACFHNEISALNAAIKTKYVNNPFQRAANSISFSPLKKQAKNRTWPAEIVELLSAVQNTKSQINVREVSNIIRGVSLGQENFKQRLLNNMAAYADAHIKPKADSKEHKKDPSGEHRYAKDVVDRLCNFFRQSSNPGYYDYATPFVRMVTMLKYPDIFDISQEFFVKNVLLEGYEDGTSSAPLYLSVSSCNILAYTKGEIIPQHKTAPLQYKVFFKLNTQGMIQWPDAGFY